MASSTISALLGAVFLLGRLPYILAQSQVPIYVNAVPEYDLLSSCAEAEVSTVVRDMAYGCGDGGHTTSYTCFCYQSSLKYSSMIGTRVAKACTADPAQNTSAVEVFSKYCQLGQLVPAETTSASSSPTTLSTATSSAVPASTPSSAAAGTTPAAASETSPFGSSTPPTSNTSDNTSRTIGIAVGATVAGMLLLTAAVAVILIRRRKQQELYKSQETTQFEVAADERHMVETKGVEIYELRREPSPPPVEIGVGKDRVELPVHFLEKKD